MSFDRVQDLKNRKEKIKLGGGEENIGKQHEKGKLTSRERLALLFDPGSFVEIDAFVKRRRRWIFTKLDEVNEASAKLVSTQPSRFATGAKIPYRGRMMRLTVSATNDDGITVTYNNGFYVDIPLSRTVTDKEIKTAIESWMKERLRMDCRDFVRRYEAKLGLRPQGIRVKDQKHLWGSLGKDQIININWHLVFAPKQITEYVVAHEMCHLKHKNHSPAFWSLLRSVFKATDECRSWLERNKEVWEMGV